MAYDKTTYNPFVDSSMDPESNEGSEEE